MNIRIYILIFLLCTLRILAQSVENVQSVEHNNASIKANFSAEIINAYQESSNLKVEDFYYYLTLYSNVKTDSLLKVEVRKNILQLFENNNTSLIDFFSETKERIPLEVFLNKIENQNYVFEASKIKSSEVTNDYWITNYELKIEHNTLANKKHYQQQVIFKRIQKTFGSKTKEVWTIFLGEMGVVKTE